MRAIMDQNNTETLPTHSRLAKIANSNKQNIYKQVYRNTLGPQGKCVRGTCTEQKEDTIHALCQCQHVRQWWERTEETITRQWEKKQENYNEVSWRRHVPEGWKPQWTAAGAVPKEAIQRVGKWNPAVHKLLTEAATEYTKQTILVWEQRRY